MDQEADKASGATGHADEGITSTVMAESAVDIRRLRLDAFKHPGNASAWRTLGRELRATGDRLGAGAAFARSVTASLADLELATIDDLLKSSRLSDAGRLIAHRLGIDGDDVVALRLGGDLAVMNGRLQEGEHNYRRCIDLCPSYVQARYGLSRLLLQQARLWEASNEAERMLASSPTDAKIRILRAAVAANVGDHEDAAALYQGLATELPRQPALWLGLGHSHRTSGRTDDAITAYRRAADAPGGAAEAYWSLSNLKTYSFDESDLRRMSDLAGEATEQQATYLNFALGQAFDARGDDDRAFAAFAKGNALKRATITYDATLARRRLEHWTGSVTTELIAARSGEGAQSSAPIFIVGLPRTGSTLVEQILGSHSLIESTAELPYMDRLASQLARRGLKAGHERANLNLNGIDLESLGQEYMRAAGVHRKTTKPFFIDKSPDNFAHAGLIRLMLPNAKIIDVRRHPLATVWSVFKQLFSQGHLFAYDLQEIAHRYRDHVTAMTLFDASMPGAILRLSYEDLVDDVETQIRRMLDYIGVGFEPACMAFHENGNAVRTPSSEQVRRPIFRHALDDWQRYRTHLSSIQALVTSEPSERPSPART